MRTYFKVLLISFSLIPNGVFASVTLSPYTFPIPKSDSVMWIAKDTNLNGVKTSIVSIQSDLLEHEFISLIKRVLSNKGGFQDVTDAEGRRVISQNIDSHFLTLQLTSRDSPVTAFLTVSEPYTNPAQLDIFHLPAGFTLLNHIKDSRSESATIASDFSLTETQHRLQSAMHRGGWNAMGRDTNLVGDTLYFSHVARRATAYIAKHEAFGSKTLIFINSGE